MTQAPNLHLIAIPTTDNGSEIMWVEEVAGMYRLLSVPVFVYGVSRNAMLSATVNENRLQFKAVVRPSEGATVRCYLAMGWDARDVYKDRIEPDSDRYALRCGPATLFDPEVIALHVAERKNVTQVGRYLDALTQQGVLKFWELGDPVVGADRIEAEASSEEAWELVHPLPVDGKPAVAQAH